MTEPKERPAHPIDRAKLAKCKSKVRFKTIESAWNHGKQFGQRAYRCPLCKGNHLSSKNYDFNRAYDDPYVHEANEERK